MRDKNRRRPGEEEEEVKEEVPKPAPKPKKAVEPVDDTRTGFKHHTQMRVPLQMSNEDFVADGHEMTLARNEAIKTSNEVSKYTI